MVLVLTMLGFALAAVVIWEAVTHADRRLTVLAGVGVDQIEPLLAAFDWALGLLHYFGIVGWIASLQQSTVHMTFKSP